MTTAQKIKMHINTNTGVIDDLRESRDTVALEPDERTECTSQEITVEVPGDWKTGHNGSGELCLYDGKGQHQDIRLRVNCVQAIGPGVIQTLPIVA